MELFIFLSALFGLLLLGVPVAIALILCSLFLFIYGGNFDPFVLAQQVISGSDNYILITVPFFILAGEIMKEGGISRQFISFSEVIVGRLRGGLGYVTILACMLFAGLSGIAIADVSALGGMLIPMMVANGYDKGRATGLVCSASLTAPIIPPSLPMIILGVSAELSIGRLFMMGIVPGVLLGLSLMFAWFIMVRRDGYNDRKIIPSDEIPSIVIKAIPALVLPVLIIFGIRLGLFTPTEGGAVACVYALFVAVVVNRELKLSRLPDILYNAMKTTSVVMFIVGGATTVGWLISMADVPTQIVEMLSGLTSHPLVLLLLLNLLLLAIGMVLDITPIILIFSPVLFPLVDAAGIDVYYFAIIMIINLSIGLLTPPVGTVLFVGCSVSGLKLVQVVRGVAPFLMAEFLFLGACLAFPEIIMAPAKWFGQ